MALLNQDNGPDQYSEDDHDLAPAIRTAESVRAFLLGAAEE
ncbi:hypothetical protein [Amycolatopsis rhizosphaerae]|nr:hypothetical protein [Amycolatopsis rhizosphaerae]